MSATATQTGMFLATWEIGGGKPGAPTFTVKATVTTPSKTFSGVVTMSQATNPPPSFTSNVKGTYIPLVTMQDGVNEQFEGTGTGMVSLEPPAIGEAIVTNFELSMVLNENFSSGTANVRYLMSGSHWKVLENLPVTQI